MATSPALQLHAHGEEDGAAHLHPERVGVGPHRAPRAGQPGLVDGLLESRAHGESPLSFGGGLDDTAGEESIAHRGSQVLGFLLGGVQVDDGLIRVTHARNS